MSHAPPCVMTGAVPNYPASVRAPGPVYVFPSMHRGCTIDTVSTTGKLVFHVFAALAQFDRNLIRERTLAGLKAARALGRNSGRPKKLSPKDEDTSLRLGSRAARTRTSIH